MIDNDLEAYEQGNTWSPEVPLLEPVGGLGITSVVGQSSNVILSDDNALNWNELLNECQAALIDCSNEKIELEEEVEELTDIVDSVSRNPRDSIMDSQSSAIVISLYDQNLPTSPSYTLKETVHRIDVYTTFSGGANRLQWDRVLVAPWIEGDNTGPVTQLLKDGIVIAGSSSTHPRLAGIDTDTAGTVYQIQAQQQKKACVPCPTITSAWATVATITINSFITPGITHTASSGSISVAGSTTLNARQP